ERDPAVENERGAAAEYGLPVGIEGDVVDDPDPVAEALGTAELDGLPDGWQPEGLAGVDRDVEVLVADLVERLEVAGRRKALLRAGDIEADGTDVAPADRRLGDLDRAGVLPHRGAEVLHGARPAGDGRPDP